MNSLMLALQKKYEADIELAKANIEVYLKNPVGIGDHPDLVAAVDCQVDKLCEASDKLKTLNEYFKDIFDKTF